MKWKGKVNFDTRPEYENNKVFSEAAGELNSLTEKSTPVSSDLLLIEDSAASNAKKKIQIGNIANVFGSEYEESVNEGESSTTSSTYQNKINFTTASKPAGKYRIGFYGEITSYGNDKQTFIALSIEDTQVCESSMMQKNGGTSYYQAHSGFYNKTLASESTISIKVQYKTVSDTAYIRRARIEIWRVS